MKLASIFNAHRNVRIKYFNMHISKWFPHLGQYFLHLVWNWQSMPPPPLKREQKRKRLHKIHMTATANELNNRVSAILKFNETENNFIEYQNKAQGKVQKELLPPHFDKPHIANNEKECTSHSLRAGSHTFLFVSVDNPELEDLQWFVAFFLLLLLLR